MSLLLSITLSVALPAGPAAAGPKPSLALASGIRMSYVEQGPGDAPPLVLLHGLGDTSRSWSLMLPELARSHRVYALDLRGHGDTQVPECCYALSDLAYDVVAFMDAKGIRRAAVAGHSLGSFVAQRVAATRPERVTRLVLLGSADTTVGTEVIEWLWSRSLGFGDAVDPAFVDEWQSNPTPVDPAFLAKVKAETAAVPTLVWKSIALALRTESQRSLLADIQAPTLILWGVKDGAFLAADQDRLRQALPAASFKAYPDVGHNLHWEIPQAVAAEMAGFLSSPAGRAGGAPTRP